MVRKMIAKALFRSFVIFLAFYMAFILIGMQNIWFFSQSIFTDVGLLVLFFFILGIIVVSSFK